MTRPDNPDSSDWLRLNTSRGRAVLAATIVGSGMTFLDGTIVTVATKRIGQDFDAGFGALQWIVNGYLLALASLILLGGSFGDRWGRKRLYLIGTIWFTVASVGCALAPNVEFLIAARVVQGIGGALLTPGSLAIITASFHPDDRGAAVGAWSGFSGVTTALGPVLGGWLVDDLSWRWAFGINVIFAVVVVVLARQIPETHGDRGGRLDVTGVLLAAGALALLTVGSTQSGGRLRAGPLLLLVAGMLVLVVFVVVERRSRSPLVPPKLFTDRTFSGTNAMTLLTYAALGAVMFVLALHLQIAAEYDALTAGLATVPITIVMLLLSSRSGALADRIGPRLQLIAGPLLGAAGCLLLLRIDAGHHNYWLDVLPGVLLFGLGITTFVAPLTSTVMASAPDDMAGIASGVNNAVARTGSLLAVAILPPLAGLRGQDYREIAVMVHGYRVITVSCAAMLVGAAVIVALTVRNVTHAQPVDEKA